MPDLSGGMGCNPGLSPPARPDLPQHNFSGANSWVLRAVRALYPDYETGLSQAAVDDSIARNEAMLRAASDLEAIERNDHRTRGIVVLGLDAPEAELAQSFALAAAQPLVRGFAVGRTIFGDVARAWMTGTMDDAQAVAAMASTYARRIPCATRPARVPLSAKAPRAHRPTHVCRQFVSKAPV